MPIDDPKTWMEGVGAAKSVFDMLRGAIGLVRDARGLKQPSEQETRAIDVALDTAEKNAAIAEAALAQSFGFELCKCQFPPVIMLTVGTHINRARVDGKTLTGPVFECPKCGHNTAGPFSYNRTAPTRDQTT